MISREQLSGFIETRKVFLAVLLSVIMVSIIIVLLFSLAVDSSAKEKQAGLEKNRLDNVILPERMWFPLESLEEPQLLFYRGIHPVWNEMDALMMYEKPSSDILDALTESARSECMSILESAP